MMIETVLSRSVRLICAGGLVVGMHAAQAQDTSAPMQRVEITGSAIKRIDAETAVPISVIKIEDLKRQGVTTIEQVMSNLAVSQAKQGTSQVVGLGTGGASFANLRGIGQNKTLVLLNGRRLANNALDSSAPDLNMIPFAALLRVEVLRDGASSLYGSDAVGGVINFITRKDFQGGTVTLGADRPKEDGGRSNNANIGYGYGDLDKDGFNFFAVFDRQEQKAITGTQRNYNKRFAGGLSPTTSPANYFQDDPVGNPTAPACGAPNLIPGAGSTTSCQMTTSAFVDYIPKSERNTAMLKGTVRLNENHELGLEYMVSQTKVRSQIAPVPYGGLIQNRVRADGSLNPFYPGNPGGITPNIPLNPAYTEDPMPDGAKPGFINVKWRDLPNGPRAGDDKNDQQRLVVSLNGKLAGWDYESGLSYNENKVRSNLSGYSNGGMISDGVLNGVINPFGAQDAAGTALLDSAALSGTLQTAKGTMTLLDAHASREVGDWFGAGRGAALALGAEAGHQKFENKANTPFAEKVIASTGLDPNTNSVGSRSTYAAFAELSVPVLKDLDLAAAVRYDKYSDFGSTTNPKVTFRYQPTKQVLVRGSYSTGFRAPSLYEINAASTYTNTSEQNDPVNCPDGKPIPGKPAAANCNQQFQSLAGGNKNLKPEKSKNATFGLVIEPTADLSFGIDFWWIRLKQSIAALDADTVFGDPAQFASAFHRNGKGNLSTDGSQCATPTNCGYVDLRTQNLGGTNTNGVDLSANYKWRSAELGSFLFGFNGTYINKYEYQNVEDGGWYQNVGIYSGANAIFRVQTTANVSWSKGPYGAGLTAHYKSSYLDQTNANNPDGTATVGTYTTFDGYASWNAMKGLTFTAGLRNMFDRAPPLSLQKPNFQAGYDARYADPIGRTLYLRGSYSF